MRIPPFLSGFLASFLLLFAIDAHAQVQLVRPQRSPLRPIQDRAPRQAPVTALSVAKFKLLSPGTGWVSTGNGLLWTTDNGEHWRDISPPNPNRGRYADVSFADDGTGWVLFVGEPRKGECSESDHSENDWAFHLAATVDGGGSWTEAHVKLSSCDSGKFGPSLNGNGNVTFADKLHGWIMLGLQSGSAFNFGALLVTSDGGLTWRKTKGSPGFYGEIRAFPNGTLWAAKGESADDELAVSRDGGSSFEDVSLDAPQEILPAAGATYGLPIFEGKLHGYESVRFDGPEGTASAAVLFETRDGGRTWKPDRTLSNLLRKRGDAVAISTSVADSTWLIPLARPGGRRELLKLGANQRVAAPTDLKSGDLQRCVSSFLTSDEGWLACPDGLFSTSDGGADWTEIGPRMRGGVLTTDPATAKRPASPRQRPCPFLVAKSA